MPYRPDRNFPASGSAALTRRNRQQPRAEARLRNALGPPPQRGGRRQSWKRALQDILWEHNDRHATKPKSVSFKTQSERAAGLFRCFRDLHALGYKIRNPYCLGGRHVRALVETGPRPGRGHADGPWTSRLQAQVAAARFEALAVELHPLRVEVVGRRIGRETSARPHTPPGFR